MIARGVTPCIARAEGCVFGGIAAREPARARAMLDELGIDGAMAYTYDELLHADDIDAVYVTLPNHLHCQWTCRFLRAGKHVLCEKPWCGTREEAQRMKVAAEESGRLVAEAFMYMHHPQTDALIDLATNPDSPTGAIKAVHSAFCVHQTHEPTIRTRMSHACHGGSIMDLGCYSLSFVSLIAGHDAMEIEFVDMTLGEPLEGETQAVDDDMIVRGSIKTQGIDAGFIAESSFRDARGVHVTLVGEHAVARTGWPWAPPHDRAEIAITAHNGEPIDTLVFEDAGEKFQLQFESFARALRDNGAPMRPDAAWSVAQAELIERVRQMGGMHRFGAPKT
ncbi:MAG: Gfo/Idh/MocA family oxidoreductase [Phycisphaerales bacterium]